MLAHTISPTIEQQLINRFQAEGLMPHLGAQLVSVQPGHVTIELPCSPTMAEQDGVFHAERVTSMIDAVCEYAAYTQTVADAPMRTAAYKVNILNRSPGDKLIIHGRVLRAGQKVTMCHGEALVYQNGREQVYATMLVTLVADN